MFKSKTVFVLGAGASYEFDLPLGSELANSIRGKMDLEYDSVGNLTGSGDKQLLLAVSSVGRLDLGDVLAAAKRLRRGLPLRKSIDDFLDIHREDHALVTLGKSAIVKAILEAERKSNLAVRRALGDEVEFQSAVDTWLAKLVKMLDQSGPDALVENAAFVSFNYDRTLEYFLFHALQALYGYDQTRATELVERIKIFHPYGTVGRVAPSSLQFYRGVPPSDAECVKLANSIRTYTEEALSAGLASIHTALSEAQRIIFLGFGFHEPNLKLLTPSAKLTPKQVWSSAFGIPPQEHEFLKRRIGSIFRHEPGIMLFSGTCRQMFDDYWFTFSQM